MTGINRREFIKRAGSVALAAPAVALAARTVNAATPIQALLYQYPAAEYFAQVMKEVPGVDVNVQLMPASKAMELLNINLASGSDMFDLVLTNDMHVLRYARNGWLRPLDDLWEKYKDEYNLADIDDSFLAGSKVDGTLYQLPNEFNSHITMFRKDLYQEKGLKVEATVEEFRHNAEKLKTDAIAGTVLMCQMGDQCATHATYYLNNIGDGWFHNDWRLAVNSDRGISAIDFLRDMGGLAQRGYTTAGGAEGSLALHQGFAAMGHMWLSRASTMEDPKKSRVVGKIGYVAPAQGGQRLSVSGYAISKFSKQDPDTLFRVMLETLKEKSLRGNIANNVPTRVSVLGDQELLKKYPYLVAATDAARSGKYFPSMPYYGPLSEIVTRRILQVLSGEVQTREAMDLAAAEGNKYLLDNGFLKA
ncbi:extracellular solute-binding protein [Mesorhizobium sp. YR577]|uniref:ABC transporter substrate-binding protein n=1 Tax=Mesorhizobium sp. YR577 TaxID=1884373 RepID=UPI0008E29A3F|nr:extracellular solute-binding protein [Mesorhizobium sp. YR577]SFU19623.1 carbohydrate ABC transporter substrate-binding protein, CUT1 family [Mesorhizobium sp. YR577]